MTMNNPASGNHASPGSTLMAGQRHFGRFVLRRLVLREAGAEVWSAQDEMGERAVELHVLPDLLALDRRLLDELKQETLRVRAMTHPRLVRVLNFWEDGRIAAIATEPFDGRSLADLARERTGRPFEPSELRAWLGRLCDALDELHGLSGRAHGDLRPANLVVTVRGDLKIAGLGISALVTDALSRLVGLPDSADEYAHMSPQRLMGGTPTLADDVYALGSTVYALLSGDRPVPGSDTVAPRLRGDVAPAIRQRREALGAGGESIPESWERTIAACLAADPQQRPQQMGQVAAGLGLLSASARRATDGSPPVAATHGEDPECESVRQGRWPAKFGPGEWFLTAGLACAVLVGVFHFAVHKPSLRRLAAGPLAEVAAREAAARSAAERGGVVVRSEPVGALVRVGDSGGAQTPAVVRDLPPGRYPVRITLEDHEDWAGEIEVRRNEFSLVNVSLVRNTGRVVITATPATTEVYFGDQVVGPVPVVLLKEPTGPVQFTLRAKGYKPATVNGVVQRGTELRLEAALRR